MVFNDIDDASKTFKLFRLNGYLLKNAMVQDEEKYFVFFMCRKLRYLNRNHVFSGLLENSTVFVLEHFLSICNRN